jgi:hypothetical protein
MNRLSIRLWRSALVLWSLLGLLSLSVPALAQSATMLPTVENLQQLASDAQAAGKPSNDHSTSALRQRRIDKRFIG